MQPIPLSLDAGLGRRERFLHPTKVRADRYELRPRVRTRLVTENCLEGALCLVAPFADRLQRSAAIAYLAGQRAQLAVYSGDVCLDPGDEISRLFDFQLGVTSLFSHGIDSRLQRLCPLRVITKFGRQPRAKVGREPVAVRHGILESRP